MQKQQNTNNTLKTQVNSVVQHCHSQNIRIYCYSKMCLLRCLEEQWHHPFFGLCFFTAKRFNSVLKSFLRNQLDHLRWPLWGSKSLQYIHTVVDYNRTTCFWTLRSRCGNAGPDYDAPSTVGFIFDVQSFLLCVQLWTLCLVPGLYMAALLRGMLTRCSKVVCEGSQ